MGAAEVTRLRVCRAGRGKPAMKYGFLRYCCEATLYRCPCANLPASRHGACSMLLAGGVPIEVVQMILGHASPAITRNIYGHPMKSSAANRFEAASSTRHATVTCAPWNTCRGWHEHLLGLPWSVRVE
jgi:integrase